MNPVPSTVALANPTVRLISIGDLPVVSALFDAYRQFNGKTSDEATGRVFLEQRLQSRESVILVAESAAGTVVGFTQLFPTFSSVSLGRVFIVNDLYVDPTHRRSGIGSALLQAAAQHAREAGAIRISASTAVENIATQILNERNGFMRDSSFLVYHLRTTDLGT